MLGGIFSAEALGEVSRATALFHEPIRKHDLLAAPREVAPLVQFHFYFHSSQNAFESRGLACRAGCRPPRLVNRFANCNLHLLQR